MLTLVQALLVATPITLLILGPYRGKVASPIAYIKAGHFPLLDRISQVLFLVKHLSYCSWSLAILVLVLALASALI